MLRKFLKALFKTLGAVFLSILIYLIAAIALSWLPANSDFAPCEKEPVEIYIRSNGVHTDIVVPAKHQLKDWTPFVNPADTKSGDTLVNNVAFGWGDKGFYLETPTWGDLKFSTAFKAAFFLSSSAMHVTFYKRMDENKSCRKICISKESYLKLVRYIEDSFAMNDGMSILIKGASYSDKDAFYEAAGTYNLFFTCNTWANNGLKAAGLKACTWTPFDKGIFYQYSE